MRIGVLYAHPIRMRMNTVLYRREMSPTQWLEEFGGGSYGKVLGHFRTLEKHGWLRKVRSRKDLAGRGRARHLYRATELPVIDDETWAELPISIQVAFTARCMRHLGERVGDALARGAVDAQVNSDRLFSCRSVRLDDQGWEAAMAILRDCFFSLAQEQLDAKVRLDTSPEPGRLMTIALAGFESPRSGSARSANTHLGAVRSDDHPPLRLSDDGDLPLSTRMAKVFADPLSLRILKELHSEDMSPSQLETKVGGASLQAFDRRCQTLTELGWLVRLGREADSPLVLYRAAGPEAFDADIWGGIPESAEQAPSWPVFDEFCKKAEAALRQGSFNARQNRHVTWCTFLLDERGWLQVTRALNRCNDKVKAVAAEAKERALAAKRPAPPYLATFLLARFEDPEGDCDC
jgi:DNA-binding HxlR family transcriptional regulator/DNA-binding PadR family transcriptional regulator